MKVIVHPSNLKGIVTAPASKSSMQRALAAALIKKGTTIIHNPGHSEDDKAAIEIIQSLGAIVKKKNGNLVIESSGVNPRELAVNCGESGLAIRMFTPIIALSDKEITITGKGSLLERPMNFFDEVLPQLGVTVSSNDGKLPITIKGPLQPKDIEIDGSLSSQFLTGLLMAYSVAPLNPTSFDFAQDKRGTLEPQRSTVSIKVSGLKSKPYIDLTLDVMKKFGLSVPEIKNYEEFVFQKDLINQLTNLPINYTVESDWSGAAFLLVAGAIAGPITVRGLDLTSSQADKKIVDALMSANAGIAMEVKGIKVHPTEMNAFDFDATDCPDLFPPLVALAAYCSGKTSIKGVHRLTHKESNRADSLQQEFGKMGVSIIIEDDTMIIDGGRKLKGTTVSSHHDHRIAMACAVAALKAEGDTIIEYSEAVKKSYPDFFHDLKSIGADVSLPITI